MSVRSDEMPHCVAGAAPVTQPSLGNGMARSVTAQLVTLLSDRSSRRPWSVTLRPVTRDARRLPETLRDAAASPARAGLTVTCG